MNLYTTEQAGRQLDLATRTVQKYCQRYGIGEKLGRDWLLNADDIESIRVRMREAPVVESGTDNDLDNVL